MLYARTHARWTVIKPGQRCPDNNNHQWTTRAHLVKVCNALQSLVFRQIPGVNEIAQCAVQCFAQARRTIQGIMAHSLHGLDAAQPDMSCRTVCQTFRCLWPPHCLWPRAPLFAIRARGTAGDPEPANPDVSGRQNLVISQHNVAQSRGSPHVLLPLFHTDANTDGLSCLVTLAWQNSLVSNRLFVRAVVETKRCCASTCFVKCWRI